MAITVNTFNSMTFLPFSDAAWAALLPADVPQLPAPIATAVLSGDPVFGFILSAGDPFTLLVEGAVATIPASVVDSEAVQPSEMITSSFGTRSDLARSLDGLLLYWRTGGQLWTYDATAIADIHSITT